MSTMSRIETAGTIVRQGGRLMVFQTRFKSGENLLIGNPILIAGVMALIIVQVYDSM